MFIFMNLTICHSILSLQAYKSSGPWSYLRVPRVGFGAHVCYHCRTSPPRFLAECRKRRLNQSSFVLLFFRLSTLFDLYLVCACLFSCTALFVSIGQVIGCEDRLRNDLLCVGWGVKLLTHSLTPILG